MLFEKKMDCCLVTTSYSRVNTNVMDTSVHFSNRGTCAFDNHDLIKGDMFFNPGFCGCFIVDLLVQHRFFFSFLFLL